MVLIIADADSGLSGLGEHAIRALHTKKTITTKGPDLAELAKAMPRTVIFD